MPRTNRITTDDGDCAVLASSLHRRSQAMQEAIMDSDRFDALARCLSEGTTRRRLTRLLGGLALGSLLRPPASAAEKGGNHKKSDKDKKGHKEKARSEKGKKGDDGKRDTGGHEKGKQNTDETKDIHGHKAKASGDGKQGTPEIAGTDTTATVTASATTGGCLSPGAPCSVNLKCCSGKCSKRICPPCVNNTDCPSNQVCQSGRCATCNGISCGNGCGCLAGSVCEDGGCVPCPAGTKECARDIGGTVVVSCTPLDDCCPSRGNDCPAVQVCQEDGQCGCNGTRCGDNCTCASDQVCWDGWCNDPSCFDDAECPHNQFCQNGACVCPGELCGYDDCCVGGMICQDGQCVHTSCINTADCSPNQYCYNGQCRCNTPCGTRCCVPCSRACN